METKNEGLEDDFPFQTIQGVVFVCFFFGGGVWDNWEPNWVC